MSNSLLEHLSAINDLVEDVIRENNELKARLKIDVLGFQNRKKLTKREVDHIREMRRSGYTQAEIAEAFDINPATVSRIIRGIYHK